MAAADVHTPNRFVIPPDLLAQLRERRARQREARSVHTTAPRVSFSDSLRALFGAETPNAQETAVAFARGMDAMQIEVEVREDAFLLDPGMGPMTYLTADGRVLVDHRTWFGDAVHEASLDDAIPILVVGARKTGLPKLLQLIPACPEGGLPCTQCDSERWDIPAREHGLEHVCGVCRGRGWVPSLL